MLYVGFDLSRKRLDWQALGREGEHVGSGAVAPDGDALAQLGQRLGDAPVRAVIESMSGTRFVHDQHELAGWDVRIAAAVKARGLAPLACKTNRIVCWVLAEPPGSTSSPRSGCPPGPYGPGASARFRLHLAKHRSALKNPCTRSSSSTGSPPGDLFVAAGRYTLTRLRLPEPWGSTVAASLALIDQPDDRINQCECELRRLGADPRCIPLLTAIPGVAWVRGYTIAAEIGDIERFPRVRKLLGYPGLTPRVEQSGERDRRGALRRNGPNYLRWALIEAAHSAGRHHHYRPIVARIRARHSRKRGTKIAAIAIGLTEAIWHMLSHDRPFAPAGAPTPVTA